MSRKKKEENVGRELSSLLTSSKPFRFKIKAIISALEDAVNTSGKLLYLAKAQGDAFISFSFTRGRRRELPAGSTEGIASSVRKTRKPVILADARNDPRYSSRVDIPLKRNDKTLAVFPLNMGATLVGILEIGAKSLSKNDIETIGVITHYLTVVCAQAYDLARIEELTITDTLTGLYNARHLTRMVDMEVRRAQRYGGVFSVVFIDLDNFKEVNDKHGHLVGSRVLQEVGGLLSNSLREDIDSAYRYGGDEFVHVLPNTDRKGATIVAQRLQNFLKSRVFRDDNDMAFNITASVGIANFPEDAHNRKEIIRMADEAMYNVKNKGRDGISTRL